MRAGCHGHPEHSAATAAAAAAAGLLQVRQQRVHHVHDGAGGRPAGPGAPRSPLQDVGGDGGDRGGRSADRVHHGALRVPQHVHLPGKAMVLFFCWVSFDRCCCVAVPLRRGTRVVLGGVERGKVA